MELGLSKLCWPTFVIKWLETTEGAGVVGGGHLQSQFLGGSIKSTTDGSHPRPPHRPTTAGSWPPLKNIYVFSWLHSEHDEFKEADNDVSTIGHFEPISHNDPDKLGALVCGNRPISWWDLICYWAKKSWSVCQLLWSCSLFLWPRISAQIILGIIFNQIVI